MCGKPFKKCLVHQNEIHVFEETKCLRMQKGESRTGDTAPYRQHEGFLGLQSSLWPHSGDQSRGGGPGDLDRAGSCVKRLMPSRNGMMRFGLG